VPIVHSHHRGVDVVLSRRHVSPHLLGSKRLRASRLFDSLPPAAKARDWLLAAEKQTPDGNLGAMGNNRVGNCTIAAPGHFGQIWTANNGPMWTPSDELVMADYGRIDGYVEGNPATDQGGVIADVMAEWERTSCAGSTIDGYVPVNPQNLDHVFKAIDRYGGLNLGVSLPLDAQDQSVWTLAISAGDKAEAGSWGGHDLIAVAYDVAGGWFDFETWGMRQRASLDWVLSYCDEAWAPICKKLWAPNGSAPNGYAAIELETDLQAVA
jgi:hypothetical protein